MLNSLYCVKSVKRNLTKIFNNPLILFLPNSQELKAGTDADFTHVNRIGGGTIGKQNLYVYMILSPDWSRVANSY